MYTVVLLLAMGGGAESPALGHHKGSDGCSGCYGCTGYVTCAGCQGDYSGGSGYFGYSSCSGPVNAFSSSCEGHGHHHFGRHHHGHKHGKVVSHETCTGCWGGGFIYDDCTGCCGGAIAVPWAPQH
jgi:hypothetical protein